MNTAQSVSWVYVSVLASWEVAAGCSGSGTLKGSLVRYV